MKVFDDMDKEQASMYRWIRSLMSNSMLAMLTGKMVTSNVSMKDLEIDSMLRESFLQHEAMSSTERIASRSRVRQGLLPPALGAALHSYTLAVEECAMFAESFGGPTFSDVNTTLETEFRNLCNEMAKLR